MTWKIRSCSFSFIGILGHGQRTEHRRQRLNNGVVKVGEYLFYSPLQRGHIGNFGGSELILLYLVFQPVFSPDFSNATSSCSTTSPNHTYTAYTYVGGNVMPTQPDADFQFVIVDNPTSPCWAAGTSLRIHRGEVTVRS